jgi:hypothetical protein
MGSKFKPMLFSSHSESWLGSMSWPNSKSFEPPQECWGPCHGPIPSPLNHPKSVGVHAMGQFQVIWTTPRVSGSMPWANSISFGPSKKRIRIRLRTGRLIKLQTKIGFKLLLSKHKVGCPFLFQFCSLLSFKQMFLFFCIYIIHLYKLISEILYQGFFLIF